MLSEFGCHEKVFFFEKLLVICFVYFLVFHFFVLIVCGLEFLLGSYRYKMISMTTLSISSFHSPSIGSVSDTIPAQHVMVMDNVQAASRGGMPKVKNAQGARSKKEK